MRAMDDDFRQSTDTFYSIGGKQKTRHEECRPCAATQRYNVGRGVPEDGYFGSARASMHHEFSRRLGYSTSETGAPDDVSKEWK